MHKRGHGAKTEVTKLPTKNKYGHYADAGLCPNAKCTKILKLAQTT